MIFADLNISLSFIKRTQGVKRNMNEIIRPILVAIKVSELYL